MFTGIIEETGKAHTVLRKDKSMIIKVLCSKVLEGIQLGDSIAVNGVCLTVVNFGSDFFEADISYETMTRSALKDMRSGNYLNLERALTLSSRLGGHIVQGHVDGVGRIISVLRYGDFYNISISYPKEIGKYIVSKGSITVDGISLTVAKVDDNSFEIAVIPHTFENTTLKYKKQGAVVNLESDVIARYVERMMLFSKKDDSLKEKLLSFGRN